MGAGETGETGRIDETTKRRRAEGRNEEGTKGGVHGTFLMRFQRNPEARP